ncbi:unnamed protein product, partial [marine sediment metagenome]
QTFDWYIYSSSGSLLGSAVGLGFEDAYVDGIDNIKFYTGADSITYWDAFGYSWDPNYTVGDNMECRNSHFPATYSFENDASGSIPDGWIDNSGEGCSATVISGFGGHNDVLDLHDQGGYPYQSIIKVGFSAQTSGTVEFWWNLGDDKSREPYVRLETGGTPVVWLNTWNKWTYRDGSGWVYLDLNNNNQWYHHRIDFECGAGGYMGLPAHRFDWYVDGIQIVNDAEFYYDADSVDNFYLSTNPTYCLIHSYIDAVGFSWDPSYNIGDNIKSESWVGGKV